MERIYTIPLSEAYKTIRQKRARKAVKIIRSFAAKHMHVEEENVRMSMGVNSKIWARSIQKPPRKIKVKIIKEKEDDTEVVKVMLLDETWKVVKINYPDEEGESKKEKPKSSDDKKDKSAKEESKKDSKAKTKDKDETKEEKSKKEDKPKEKKPEVKEKTQKTEEVKEDDKTA
ncbi:50S ribosomal protein L31e [Candidatus Micrarchaeota archaeon]|nr:50S ribosomal protein L31e [Candidatus Micrarchaeota archaeon]